MSNAYSIAMTDTTKREVWDFREILGDYKVAMVTTTTDDGSLHSRPIATAQFGTDGDVYFFARKSSALATDIHVSPHVNLSYVAADGQRYASAAGNATAVDDRETAKTLWGPWCAEWFPRGLDDPEILLVRVHVATVEYWDSPLNPVARLVEFRQVSVTPEPSDASERRL
jgi:general stress protein 26